MAFECPKRLVPGWAWDVVEVAAILKANGGWPNGVGWANEPGCLVSAVRVVDAAIGE